jgi:hypothetical protein
MERKMKRFLQVCGFLFLASSVVALTDMDEKLLDKNADKVSQLRTLKNVWNAL